MLPRNPDLVVAQCDKPLSEKLGGVVLKQREAFLYTNDQLLLRESVYRRHSCHCFSQATTCYCTIDFCSAGCATSVVVVIVT